MTHSIYITPNRSTFAQPALPTHEQAPGRAKPSIMVNQKVLEARLRDLLLADELTESEICEKRYLQFLLSQSLKLKTGFGDSIH